MKKIIFFCSILLVLSNLVKSQNWTKLGKQNWPTNPYGIQFSSDGNGVRNIGNSNVQSIWVDPSDANHMLIGVFGGGIYESYNAINGVPNVTWNKITNNLPVQTVRKIVKKNNVLYASSCALFWFGNRHYSNTHGQFRNLYGLGVIKSQDNGQTWSVPTMPDNDKGFDCMGFSEPTGTGIMYANSRKRVYKSINFGDSWYEAGPQLCNGVQVALENVDVNPSDPNTVWVAGRGDGSVNKIFRSTDGGATWEEKESYFRALAGIGSGQITNSNITNYGGSTYVMLQAKNNNAYIFKSTDWQNFQLIKTVNSYGNNDIKVNNLSNVLNYYLLGMPGFYKFTDATVNNSSLNNLIYQKTHDDSRALAFTTYNGTNYLVLGHDGGVSISPDNGVTWTNISGNLVAHIINNMGYYSSPSERIFDLGTQDDGFYRNKLSLTPPYNQSQTFFTNNHEGTVYTSPHTGRIYFSNVYGDFISNDSGASKNPGWPVWDMLEDPLDADIHYHWGYPVKNSQNLFNGRYYVYKGNTQSNIFPSIFNTTTSDVGILPVLAKVGLNSNKNIILPVTYNEIATFSEDTPDHNKLFYSKDRGISWEEIGQNIKNADPGLPDVLNTLSIPISWVTMDDYNPNRIWVTFGTAGLKDQKVYESTDFGQNWNNISYNLSNVSSLGLPVNTPGNYPVSTIEYDENRDILFLGTDYGLFYLDKTTTQWKVYGNGLPRCIVSNIYIDDYFDEIVIGTAGSGVWSAPLPSCKDQLIMTDTSWSNTTVNICGDLRIKRDITLHVNSSDITAKNIILEPGAKIIWDGGVLSSSNSSNKSFVIGSRDSYFTVKNVTLNNYTVNNFEDATLQTGNLTLNDASLNVYNGSFYDNIDNTLLTLNNSYLNFYSSYYYKTHNVTGNFINSNYYSGLEKINMTGNGRTNVYDQNISIQNDNFYNRLSPVLNNGNYKFESNDNVKIGNNVNSVFTSGDVTMSSRAEVIARNFITVERGTLLKPESYLRINSLMENNMETPYSKFGATDSQIKYSEAKINWAHQKFGEEEEEFESSPNEKHSELSKDDAIKLYPIPVVTNLNYQINDKELIGKKAFVINNYGNIIKTLELVKKGVIDFTNIPAGIYYFVFESDKGKVSKKIIKQGLTDNNLDITERKNK